MPAIGDRFRLDTDEMLNIIARAAILELNYRRILSQISALMPPLSAASL